MYETLKDVVLKLDALRFTMQIQAKDPLFKDAHLFGTGSDDGGVASFRDVRTLLDYLENPESHVPQTLDFSVSREEKQYDFSLDILNNLLLYEDTLPETLLQLFSEEGYTLKRQIEERPIQDIPYERYGKSSILGPGH
ncbi:MAG: hypothetical protein ACMXYK_00885 [Candidatus Woesearchaeota archaeon]